MVTMVSCIRRFGLRVWKMFERIVRDRRLVLTVIPLAAVLLIFANSLTLNSPFVGLFALMVYLGMNGDVLGRVFFSEEKPFFRIVFGLFVFLVVLALAGILAVFVLQSELWYMLGMVLATSFSSILSLFFVRYERVEVKENWRKKLSFDVSYVFWGIYFVLLLWGLYLLFSVRSGWVRGPIWNVIPPAFLRVYFVATAFLVWLLLVPGKIRTKLFATIIHSIFSLLFIVIVSYPGIIFYDPWYDLGRARTILTVVQLVWQTASQGSISVFWASPATLTLVRLLNMFLRGVTEHVLIATFAGALSVDMYWTYVFLVPVLWGIFVPVTSYRIAEMVGLTRRSSILVAFLSIPNLYFLAWGKLTEANSLGVLFFFLFLYLLLLSFSTRKTKRIYFLIMVMLVAIGVTHFVPALVSLSLLVLAFGFKGNRRFKIKYPRTSYALLAISFLVSLFIVPSLVILRGILLPMLGTSAFSLSKLLETSPWALIFGIPEDLPVLNAVLYEIYPVLGLIGLVYVLKSKKRFNRTFCKFLFLAFMALLAEHRILKYAVVGGLFSADRLRVFIDMLALPFAALVVASAIFFIVGTVATSKGSLVLSRKKFLGGTLICVSLSAWVVASTYETYDYYTKGLLPTALEVEVVKYIDEHTSSQYVVLAPQATTVISWGFLGIPNPEKWYFTVGRGGPVEPSAREMFEYMEMGGADIGYFIAPSFRLGVDFDRIVSQASRVFGLYKEFRDDSGNELYVFYYKIPPLPTGSDVAAFYWETPAAYYVQNDLLRVMINQETGTLDIVDFWGDLYESVNFNATFVDGNPVGTLTSIEYFNYTNSRWIEWTRETELVPSERFQFRLHFENSSLIGAVESGSPSVKLQWEVGQESTWSLRIGDFRRLYIPGLVGGQDSYDVNSRNYGFLYTQSRTDNIVLQPLLNQSLGSSSLTYDEIVKYCNFTREQGHFRYDLYLENTANRSQWAYVEVWLPDEVYAGAFPPLRHSIDNGKTWINTIYNVETGGSQAIRTLGGDDVNWVFTKPKTLSETPVKWWSFEEADGGSPSLPDYYTYSGGAQNRMFFGFYLPEKDKILVRLGCSAWYIQPLEMSYVFRDSDDIDYGLRNMNRSLVTFYNYGGSEYVGGLEATEKPSSLIVVENEYGEMTSLLITLPPDAQLSLFGRKEVETTTDLDRDGIPDAIE